MRLPLRRFADFKKSLGFKVNALLIRRDSLLNGESL